MFADHLFARTLNVYHMNGPTQIIFKGQSKTAFNNLFGEAFGLLQIAFPNKPVDEVALEVAKKFIKDFGDFTDRKFLNVRFFDLKHDAAIFILCASYIILATDIFGTTIVPCLEGHGVQFQMEDRVGPEYIGHEELFLSYEEVLSCMREFDFNFVLMIEVLRNRLQAEVVAAVDNAAAKDEDEEEDKEFKLPTKLSI
jgi:hypothetical protein